MSEKTTLENRKYTIHTIPFHELIINKGYFGGKSSNLQPRMKLTDLT